MQRKPTTVLIADDDEDDRYLTKLALERMPFPCDLHFAANGQEVVNYLSVCRKNQEVVAPPAPSLILMDINMPVKNGFETLWEIKANDKNADIPVVILTTSQDPEDKKKCMSMGAAGFVTKSATMKELVATLHRIIPQAIGPE